MGLRVPPCVCELKAGLLNQRANVQNVVLPAKQVNWLEDASEAPESFCINLQDWPPSLCEVSHLGMSE